MKELGLKGNVKFIARSTYKAVEKFGEIEKDYLSSKYTDKYDEKGNVIEENKYNADGSLRSFRPKTTYKYDENGNKIEENWYNAGSLRYEFTYKYDEKGNKIEESWYNADGSLDAKYKSKYDEKGNEIEKNKYYADGSLDAKYKSKYDEKGNEIEKNYYRYYRAEGSLSSKTTYKFEFDTTGNWITLTEIFNDKPTDLT